MVSCNRHSAQISILEQAQLGLEVLLAVKHVQASFRIFNCVVRVATAPLILRNGGSSPTPVDNHPRPYRQAPSAM